MSKKKVHYGNWKNSVYSNDEWIETKCKKELEVHDKNHTKNWKKVSCNLCLVRKPIKNMEAKNDNL